MRTAWLDVTLRLAEIEREAGRTAESVGYATEALAASRERSDRHAELGALLHLAAAWDAAGEVNAAMDAYEEALTLSRMASEPGIEAPLHRRLGDEAIRHGDDELAEAHYRAALPVFADAGDVGAAGALQFDLARDRPAGGTTGRRRAGLSECAQRPPRIVCDPGAEATVLRELARVQAAMGAQEQAVRSLAQAVEPARLAGDRGAELDIQLRLASGYEQTNRDLDAAAAYKVSADAGRSGGGWGGRDRGVPVGGGARAGEGPAGRGV